MLLTIFTHEMFTAVHGYYILVALKRRPVDRGSIVLYSILATHYDLSSTC